MSEQVEMKALSAGKEERENSRPRTMIKNPAGNQHPDYNTMQEPSTSTAESSQSNVQSALSGGNRSNSAKGSSSEEEKRTSQQRSSGGKSRKESKNQSIRTHPSEESSKSPRQSSNHSHKPRNGTSANSLNKEVVTKLRETQLSDSKLPVMNGNTHKKSSNSASINGNLRNSSSPANSEELTVQALAAFRTVLICQRCQIACLFMTFTFYVIACYCASTAISDGDRHFRTKCLLNSEWKISSKPINNGPYEFYSMTTVGVQSDHWCNVTQYGFASSSIFAFIMCWFFVLFRPAQGAFLRKKTSAVSKIILPCVLLSLVMAVFTVVASIILSVGYANWCYYISTSLGSCSMADYVLHESNFYTVTSKEPTPFTAYFVSAQVFSWLGSLCWVGNVGILACRVFLHLDFPDYFFKSSVTKKISRISTSTVSGPNGIINRGLTDSLNNINNQQKWENSNEEELARSNFSRKCAFSSYDSAVEIVDV